MFLTTVGLGDGGVMGVVDFSSNIWMSGVVETVGDTSAGTRVSTIGVRTATVFDGTVVGWQAIKLTRPIDSTPKLILR